MIIALQVYGTLQSATRYREHRTVFNQTMFRNTGVVTLRIYYLILVDFESVSKTHDQTTDDAQEKKVRQQSSIQKSQQCIRRTENCIEKHQDREEQQ